jgi:hypothetical protein
MRVASPSWRCSGVSDRDIDDVLAVAQRALARVGDLEDRVAELEAHVVDLQEEQTAHALRLSELDEDRQYDTLTRDDKIGIVREWAFERAVDAGGQIALDYDDVRWGCFDGEPGAAHCYDLMQWAAEAEGFERVDPDGANIQLRVDADRAKRARRLFAEKKRGAAEGVR